MAVHQVPHEAGEEEVVLTLAVLRDRSGLHTDVELYFSRHGLPLLGSTHVFSNL